jgi:hypothetical protein
MNKIEICKKIVKEFQYETVTENGRELIIDVQTANVISTVYDALNDTNKAKLLTLDWLKLQTVCFKLVS